MATAARAEHGAIDAIVSTDGCALRRLSARTTQSLTLRAASDSDRPLVAGVNADDGSVRFIGGDLLGIVVADWLGASCVAGEWSPLGSCAH